MATATNTFSGSRTMWKGKFIAVTVTPSRYYCIISYYIRGPGEFLDDSFFPRVISRFPERAVFHAALRSSVGELRNDVGEIFTVNHFDDYIDTVLVLPRIFFLKSIYMIWIFCFLKRADYQIKFRISLCLREQYKN